MSVNRMHAAIQFAALAHGRQKRKGSEVPYLAHPFEVAQLLTAAAAPKELILAGLLHDTVEDAGVTLAQIEEEFGRAVALLVLSATEDKTKSWEERKAHTVEYLSHEASYEALMLACADKLSNLRSIAADYEAEGEAVWNRFKRGRAQQRWYYAEMLRAFAPLADTEMYREFAGLFEEVFGC